MLGGSRYLDDANIAGNRPSSSLFSGTDHHHPLNIFDATYKQSAVRRVNTYLSSHNFPIFLSLKPLPPARDIAETLKFILFRLEFPSSKLDDDLPILLKFLNCPHKINRSALKAPGTPHAFPHVLAVIHWLVQIAEFKDDILPSEFENGSLFSNFDAITTHALSCYSHFMQADDDSADALKSEFLVKIEREKDRLAQSVQVLDTDVLGLEAKLAGLRSAPSPLEALKLVKQDLEKDVTLLEDFVSKLSDGMEIMQKAVKDRERELADAVDEKERIFKESEDLKRKVQEQNIDLWEAERMKRDIQALEREIKEAESAGIELEGTFWSLDDKICQQFKVLEALVIKTHQSLKRLLLGNDLQYTLNSEGSTVREVLGIDYKSTIKAAIHSLTNEIKRHSMANSEELLALQMQNVQISSKTEEKKEHIAQLQRGIEQIEAVLICMDEEIRDRDLSYKAEAESMLRATEAEAQNLDIQHREALETLKAAERMLKETEERSKNESEKCAYELFVVIDAVSKHKEYMERKLHEMNKELCETADCLPKECKCNFSPRRTSDTKGR